MTRLKDLRESPAYQLWLATNRWQRTLRKALTPLGLTHVQYIVLIVVWRLSSTEDHVTQAAVCRIGDLDPNMASQVIRTLAERRLLTRDPHPIDGRAVTLDLTKAGLDLAMRAREAVLPVADEFFSPIDKDQALLTDMLRRINEDGGPA